MEMIGIDVVLKMELFMVKLALTVAARAFYTYIHTYIHSLTMYLTYMYVCVYPCADTLLLDFQQ